MDSWPQVNWASQYSASWMEVEVEKGAGSALQGVTGPWPGDPWQPWDKSWTRAGCSLPEYTHTLVTEAIAGCWGREKGERLTIGSGVRLQIGVEAPFWEWTDPCVHLVALWCFPTGLLILPPRANSLESLLKDAVIFLVHLRWDKAKLVCQARISGQRPGGWRSLWPLWTVRLPTPDCT